MQNDRTLDDFTLKITQILCSYILAFYQGETFKRGLVTKFKVISLEVPKSNLKIQ